MLPSFFCKAVTIVRPGTKTERGTAVPDWSDDAASRSVVRGCEVQTPTTGMDLDGRTETTIAGTVYMPQGTDVRAGDAIDYGGRRYLVDGEPIVWGSPSGALSHIQARIRDWRG